jgi:hypothetical protein
MSIDVGTMVAERHGDEPPGTHCFTRYRYPIACSGQIQSSSKLKQALHEALSAGKYHPKNAMYYYHKRIQGAE